MPTIVDAADGEVITDLPDRRLVLLSATPERTVTWTRHGPDQEGTELHVHHEHTDAFYVLEGELTVPLGPQGEPVVLRAGALAIVPPLVAHAFENRSGAPASWLNLHLPDGGFARFLQAMRDGGPVRWDSGPPPADGGRPAGEATVLSDGASALQEAGVVVLHADARGVRLQLGGPA